MGGCLGKKRDGATDMKVIPRIWRKGEYLSQQSAMFFAEKVGRC
jgi:hypothetical protein